MKSADSLMLRNIRLLEGVSGSGLTRLQEEASVQVLNAGSILFEQGESPRHAHIVLHGRIALVGSLAETEMVVELFGSGDVLLAAAVLLDRPYLVSARAVVESRIALVPAATFRAMIRSEHRLAVSMAEELALHWRILVRQIKDLKLRSASQRLAAYLLTNGAPGKSEMRISIEKQVLAGRLGMTPASLSRAFRELRQFGVDTRGNEIVLGNVEAVRAFCHYDPTR